MGKVELVPVWELFFSWFVISTEIESKHLGTSVVSSQHSYRSLAPNNKKNELLFYMSLNFSSNSFLLSIQKYQENKYWSMIAWKLKR